jgi:hypothetical protein
MIPSSEIKQPSCFGLSWVGGQPCNACDLNKDCSEAYLGRMQFKMYVVGTCSNCRSYLAGTRICHMKSEKVKPSDKACKEFW